MLAAAAALYGAPAAMVIPPVTRLLTRTARPAAGPHLILTFDDGPHPRATLAVLDILAEAGVAATFFVVGEQADRYPHVLERIAAGGHQVALHGYRHQLLLRRSPAATIDDIRRGHSTVYRITGQRPRWYRPPYGTATWPALAAAQHLQMTPLWWTCEGRDWQPSRQPAAVADRILRRDRHGHPRLDHRDVLLLHDSDAYAATGSWQATVQALPIILTEIASTGLTIGPLEKPLQSSRR